VFVSHLGGCGVIGVLGVYIGFGTKGGGLVKALCFIVVFTAMSGWPAGAMAQDLKSPGLPAPTVTTATLGILTAFQTYPLVGLGEA
jgi:hypothetical protein